ncbi:sugar transporter [Pedobacter riviphilus]|uniref:Sugar transporter n=1 Tax=Pedobacter riviphilus TaxID=2766984 RepID=A0ABX6THS1_9SPHI|nr:MULTISPECIES: protein-disulfide reductase DsbD domain-containing protein [Pedobacter]NII81023.1 DsbC/DsbD-like thiol-disulfide interchange protein [Pedobacter sp. SG908]NMN35038.1 DsbC/DsbD-like thiol-disulfide interchange protein [Pedobacter sp. SG918]QNR85013.1 sugar transporter [Pedobacter riviphilus]
MKKNLILLFICSFFTLKGFGQIYHPIKWSYAAKKTGKNEAVVFVKATLEKGWHLYSQYVEKGGPQPTKFTFEKSNTYSLIGATKEPHAIMRLEPTFMMEVGFFENAVIFQQKVKLTGKKAAVKGKVEFMVCNDKMCLPTDEVEFTVNVI